MCLNVLLGGAEVASSWKAQARKLITLLTSRQLLSHRVRGAARMSFMPRSLSAAGRRDIEELGLGLWLGLTSGRDPGPGFGLI